MIDIKQLNSNSFSFIGDGVYTLATRLYFINNKHQASKDLLHLCNRYNSASGQAKAYKHLLEINFFNEQELEIYKRGRNHINHVCKNCDLQTYLIASGLEAIVGYLYLTDKDRLKELFNKIFKGEENV